MKVFQSRVRLQRKNGIFYRAGHIFAWRLKSTEIVSKLFLTSFRTFFHVLVCDIRVSRETSSLRRPTEAELVGGSLPGQGGGTELSYEFTVRVTFSLNIVAGMTGDLSRQM